MPSSRRTSVSTTESTSTSAMLALLKLAAKKAGLTSKASKGRASERGSSPTRSKGSTAPADLPPQLAALLQQLLQSQQATQAQTASVTALAANMLDAAMKTGRPEARPAAAPLPSAPVAAVAAPEAALVANSLGVPITGHTASVTATAPASFGATPVGATGTSQSDLQAQAHMLLAATSAGQASALLPAVGSGLATALGPTGAALVGGSQLATLLHLQRQGLLASATLGPLPHLQHGPYSVHSSSATVGAGAYLAGDGFMARQSSALYPQPYGSASLATQSHAMGVGVLREPLQPHSSHGLYAPMPVLRGDAMVMGPYGPMTAPNTPPPTHAARAGATDDDDANATAAAMFRARVAQLAAGAGGDGTTADVEHAGGALSDASVPAPSETTGGYPFSTSPPGLASSYFQHARSPASPPRHRRNQFTSPEHPAELADASASPDRPAVAATAAGGVVYGPYGPLPTSRTAAGPYGPYGPAAPAAAEAVASPTAPTGLAGSATPARSPAAAAAVDERSLPRVRRESAVRAATSPAGGGVAPAAELPADADTAGTADEPPAPDLFSHMLRPEVAARMRAAILGWRVRALLRTRKYRTLTAGIGDTLRLLAEVRHEAASGGSDAFLTSLKAQLATQVGDLTAALTGRGGRAAMQELTLVLRAAQKTATAGGAKPNKAPLLPFTGASGRGAASRTGAGAASSAALGDGEEGTATTTSAEARAAARKARLKGGALGKKVIQQYSKIGPRKDADSTDGGADRVEPTPLTVADSGVGEGDVASGSKPAPEKPWAKGARGKGKPLPGFGGGTAGGAGDDDFVIAAPPKAGRGRPSMAPGGKAGAAAAPPVTYPDDDEHWAYDLAPAASWRLVVEVVEARNLAPKVVPAGILAAGPGMAKAKDGGKSQVSVHAFRCTVAFLARACHPARTSCDDALQHPLAPTKSGRLIQSTASASLSSTSPNAFRRRLHLQARLAALQPVLLPLSVTASASVQELPLTHPLQKPSPPSK